MNDFRNLAFQRFAMAQMNQLLRRVFSERCRGCRHYDNGPCHRIDTSTYVRVIGAPEDAGTDGMIRPDCYDAPGITKLPLPEKPGKPFHCDACGRFVSQNDLFARRLLTPDNVSAGKTYETLCVDCRTKLAIDR